MNLVRELAYHGCTREEAQRMFAKGRVRLAGRVLSLTDSMDVAADVGQALDAGDLHLTLISGPALDRANLRLESQDKQMSLE